MLKKPIFYVGTSAELIKLIPIIKQLEQNNVNYEILSSGQTDLKKDELTEILEIKISKNLVKNSKNKVSLFKFGIWIIKSFFMTILEFLKYNKKNLVIIVHGDTTSSMIGALAAKLRGIDIYHVESGLRSFDFVQPFPEEISRYIISKLAKVHFCPNEWAISNLKKSKGDKINTIQNTSIESFKYAKNLNKTPNWIKSLNKPYFLFILHRQENILFKKEFSLKLINEVTNYANNNLNCVFVMHKITENFLIKNNLLENLKSNPNIILIPRTPYIEFINIIEKSEFMLTDGGSNQEESFYLGKPTLIIRNVTERIEGLNENAILMKEDFKTLDYFLNNYSEFKKYKVDLLISPSKIIFDKLIQND